MGVPWLNTDYESAARPASEQRRAARARFGALQAEVREGRGGRRAPAPRALDQPFLQQVGLVDVLDRVLLLADGDRERREPNWAALELDADRAQDLAVESIETALVDL